MKKILITVLAVMILLLPRMVLAAPPFHPLVNICGNPSLISIDLSSLARLPDNSTISGNLLLTSLGVPILATIGEYCSICVNGSLPSLDLSAATAIGQVFSIINNTSMTTLDLSGALTIGDVVSITGNTVLTSLDLSSWVPTNGTQGYFGGNALSAASVNGILARYVANSGFVSSGQISLGGGTNAVPTGQGMTDAYTLCARGGITLGISDGAGAEIGCNVITWNSQPSGMTVGDPDQALTQATANSGLTVTYSTETTDYCTISGDVGSQLLHAVAAGACVVHADQAGRGGANGYMAAARVDSGTITISGP